MRLVDFDAACNTDPLYDVAILLNEAYAFEDEMMPALEMYEGRVHPATLARCRLYAVADDFYWGLWASRMDATSVAARHRVPEIRELAPPALPHGAGGDRCGAMG